MVNAAALAGRACDFEAAAEEANHFVDVGEAEADAFVAPREAAVQLGERTTDPRKLVGRDARARVRNGDHYSHLGGVGVGFQADLAAVRRELAGVVKQLARAPRRWRRGRSRS